MSRALALKDVREEASPEALSSAERAGLCYVSDRVPGIRRVKNGRGFRYLDARGKVVRDGATLRRIRALVIPPAWTEVWICPDPQGHIQAVGRDARARKQYRYHARWRSVRDETKYERIFDFAAALPKLRARCERELNKPGLSRDKVLSAVVCLLEQTLIRVGNEEYTRLNQSFGLTTLRDHHARIRGSEVLFRFRGKSGKDHQVRVNDRRLANIVKRCRDLPGEELFQYVDDEGVQRSVGSSDVNEFLRSVTGQDFTAKDFRTWAATVLAATALHECGIPPTARGAKKRIVEVVKRTAERLGNTPSVCKKSYIHPLVLDAYARGECMPRFRVAGSSQGSALRADEKAVVAFLRRLTSRHAAEQAPGGLEKILRKSVRRAQAASARPNRRNKAQALPLSKRR
jgi:DNA topoisomerase-1